MELVTLLKHLLTHYYLIKKLWVNKSFYTYQWYNEPLIWRRLIWLYRLSGSFLEVSPGNQPNQRLWERNDLYLETLGSRQGVRLLATSSGSPTCPLIPQVQIHLFICQSTGNALFLPKNIFTVAWGRSVAWNGSEWKQRTVVCPPVFLVRCETFQERSEFLAWARDVRSLSGWMWGPDEIGKRPGMFRTHNEIAPFSVGSM